MTLVKHYVREFCTFGALMAFVGLMILGPNAEQAHAASDQPVGGTEQKYVSRIDPEQVRGKPVWIVSWSDGAVKVLTPCKYEDGRRCYWDAGKAGNGYGDSFVSARGKIWYLNAYAL